MMKRRQTDALVEIASEVVDYLGSVHDGTCCAEPELVRALRRAMRVGNVRRCKIDVVRSFDNRSVIEVDPVYARQMATARRVMEILHFTERSYGEFVPAPAIRELGYRL